VSRKIGLAGVILAGYFASYGFVFAQGGKANQNGVKSILDSFGDSIPAAKTASPETFVDMSFVQELDKSGAIAQMYQ